MTLDPLIDEDLLEYHAGGLPPEAAAAIERRLAADPAARATLAEWRRQDAALAALHPALDAEPLPDRLTAVLRRVEAAPSGAGRSAAPRWHMAAAVAGALCIGLLGGWLARGQTLGAQALPASAIRAHETFVVETAYPVEVAASEAHLDAWLSNRLGHEARSPDLAAAGFALMGGRVVPSERGAAALYMYENAAGRRVTLYVARTDAAPSVDLRFAQDGATRSFSWRAEDLSYAVVGDLAPEELRSRAQAARDQLT